MFPYVFLGEGGCPAPAVFGLGTNSLKPAFLMGHLSEDTAETFFPFVFQIKKTRAYKLKYLEMVSRNQDSHARVCLLDLSFIMLITKIKNDIQGLF